MDTNLQKYFELKASSKVASDRAYAMRDTISRKLGVNLGDAQNHPDYKALAEESSRIYREVDALTPFVIRANLEQFGIEDIEVVGVLMGNDRETKRGQLRMMLSDLCGLRFYGLAANFGFEAKDVGLRVIVEQGGKQIGYVDSDGDFDYEAAPDFRSALGWKIATDGGRVRLIESFTSPGDTLANLLASLFETDVPRINTLDDAVELVLGTIRTNGVSESAFFGPYFEALKKVFVYEQTSRFGDGYCGAAGILWRVATRELGKEHPGYPFAY